MIENMHKFLKICNNTSKYAENMQKSKICTQKTKIFLIFASFIVFLKF